jgi:Kef-type K+ transport system membrane component KefB
MAGGVLLEVGIALVSLAVGGTLAVRADQSVIPMYIVAGILVGSNVPRRLGPIPLTLVENREFIDVLAELGVVFLLFSLGLEFNIDRLLEGWDRLVGIGTAGGFLYGLYRRRSLRVGVGLVPRGEFSLVIAALAATVGTGALATTIPAFAVGYVLTMSILGTMLMGYADSLTASSGGFPPGE